MCAKLRTLPKFESEHNIEHADHSIVASEIKSEMHMDELELIPK